MSSLAIIGTGIAGLGCAHFLHAHHRVTLFEQNDYTGGHTNTVTALEPGTDRELPIDTGFMVFNEVTYPHLTRLFKLLNVPIKPTDMSFSVRHADIGLEFCGSSVNHLFAQRRNLFRPRFWKLLSTINRFNQEAVAALADPSVATLSLGDYCRRQNYGSDFLELYLTPMSSAVWSTPPHLMLSFPAITLLRFFHNHGFLGLHTQHQWLTVDGGAREYVRRLIPPFAQRIRHNSPVTRILRHPEGRGVIVTTASGETETFDRAIIATHADQALRLIANPTPDEKRLLSAFNYQPNTATLHTDSSVMPRAALARAAWNYEINRNADGSVSTATHYWMNKLQGVSTRENYYVSIERPEAIDPKKIIKRIAYEHPLFDLAAHRAQPELPALNAAAVGTTETFFAGSYFRYGFHEDALMSAVNLAQQLLGRDPWAASA